MQTPKQAPRANKRARVFEYENTNLAKGLEQDKELQALMDDEKKSWIPSEEFSGSLCSDWKFFVQDWSLNIDKHTLVKTLALQGAPVDCFNSSHLELLNAINVTAWPQEGPSAWVKAAAASLLVTRLKQFNTLRCGVNVAASSEQQKLKRLEL